jgi:RimJ/RimL family protein N-acetyltransferase
VRDRPALRALHEDPVPEAYVHRDPWWGPATAADRIDQKLARIDRVLRRRGDGLVWIVEGRRWGPVLGWIAMQRVRGVEPPTYQLRVRFARSVWGKGIWTEAGGVATSLAFHDLGASVIRLLVRPDNPATARGAERLGYTKRGSVTDRQGQVFDRIELDAATWRSLQERSGRDVPAGRCGGMALPRWGRRRAHPVDHPCRSRSRAGDARRRGQGGGPREGDPAGSPPSRRAWAVRRGRGWDAIEVRSAVRRTLALPAAEQAIAVQAVAVTAVLELVLHIVPLPRLVDIWRTLSRRRGAHVLPVGRSRADLDRRVRLYRRAAQLFRPGRECVPFTLLLWWDLLADGVDARFVLGLRRAGELEAHAWIEMPDGRPYEPNRGAPYVKLHSWGSIGPAPSRS